MDGDFSETVRNLLIYILKISDRVLITTRLTAKNNEPKRKAKAL
jgi:hypothetical protein